LVEPVSPRTQLTGVAVGEDIVTVALSIGTLHSVPMASQARSIVLRGLSLPAGGRNAPSTT